MVGIGVGNPEVRAEWELCLAVLPSHAYDDIGTINIEMMSIGEEEEDEEGEEGFAGPIIGGGV